MSERGRRVLTFGVAAALGWLVPTSAVVRAAPTGLRVAVFGGTGAESDKLLALFRAVEAAGHQPLAVTKSDLVQGRLLLANFDVLILPAGEDGKKCCLGHYDDPASLNDAAAQDAIRAFLNAGGGVVAEEAAAYFASANGGTLDLYGGSYTWSKPAPGKASLEIVDPAFGGGWQQAFLSYGGGWFSVPTGASVVARDAQGRPVIVRAPYGAGRVILSSFCLELRGDSELDWTLWDNWVMGGVHENSAGAWLLLGRMIGWARSGDASPPAAPPLYNGRGHRIAVVATHTTDGGAWPGLLPAFARAIAAAAHVPLAIRFQEIVDGRLTAENFRVVSFPGGYSYGYKVGLAGHEQQIRDFVTAGAGYYGVCAGSYYAAETLIWNGVTYSYPLALFRGQDIGPIDDIAPWPQYGLTPIDISGDDVIGELGVLQMMYYGGGYHTIPPDEVQGAHVFTSATFAYGGSAQNLPAVVRFAYGAGRVLLVTTHPEARAGSVADWLYWDDYAPDSTTPVSNPDDPWRFVEAAFNNWLAGPPPPPLCSDPPDADLDGVSDLCDCAPANAAAFALPPEIRGLVVSPDGQTLSWSSAAPDAGPGTNYDVLGGPLDALPVETGSEARCLAEQAAGTSLADGEAPLAGTGVWRLVRGRNVCGIGTYGAASSGAERASAACP